MSPDETRSDREAMWDDVHAELSLALGIDDSDDGWVDAKNAATDAIMRLFDREVADRSRLEQERDELLAAMTELKRAPDRIATMTDVELEQYARRLERENTELRKQIESHDEMRLAAYAAAERDAARAEADQLREAFPDLDICRAVERERDAARAETRQWNAAHEEQWDRAEKAEAERDAARAEADDLRRLLLDETYRPEGGEIVMRELGKAKAERDAARAEADRLREENRRARDWAETLWDGEGHEPEVYLSFFAALDGHR